MEPNTIEESIKGLLEAIKRALNIWNFRSRVIS